MNLTSDKTQTTVSIMQFYGSNETLGNGPASIKGMDHFMIDLYFKMSQVLDKVYNILELIDGVIYDLSANVGMMLKQPINFLKTKK